MNNLQKLYQTIFDAGLINNSFDDFSEGMLSEDYQKKVFDAITERGFFNQDFNTFKSAYTPEKFEGSGWDSFKTSLSNAFEMVGDIKEFYGIGTGDKTVEEVAEEGNLGAYSGLNIVSTIVWEKVFGLERMKRFKNQAPNFFKTYKPSDSETFQKVIEAFKKEKEQTERTMTFSEADSIGDYLGVISGAIANVGGSVAYNLGTFGTGFFMEFAADNIITANKVKAESMGLTLDELAKSNQLDTDSALKIAAVQAGLEYVGFSRIMKPFKDTGAVKKLNKAVGKFLNEKYAKSKSVRIGLDIIGTGRTEAFTEMGQTGLEIYNKELAESKAKGEDINDLLSITKGMFSPEGIEAGLQGFVGGGGLKGGGYSAKALNTIRQTDKDLDVEQDLSDLVRLNQAFNAATDLDVKSSLQNQISKVEKNIKDKIKKGNDKYSLLTDDEISNIENLTDLANTAATRANALVEKLKNKEITRSEFNLSINALNETYTQAKNDIKEILFQKDLKFAKEEGARIGKEVKVIKSKEEFQQKYNEIRSESDFDGDVTDRDGFIKGDEIYINEVTAREQGAISVGSHELLHGIIQKAFASLSPKERKKLSKGFYNSLNSDQRFYIEKRLRESYGEQINDKFFESRQSEELFTIFSDGITLEKISFNENLFQKIGLSVEQFFQKYIPGYKKTFGNGRQAYQFLKEYNENRKAGKLGEAAIKLATEGEAITQGFSIKESMTAGRSIEVEDEINKLGKEGLLGESFVERAKELGEGMGKELFEAEFDDIYKRIQNEVYLDNLIAAQYKAKTGPRDFVKKVYSELTSHAKSFNPEINDSYFVWLNSQIGNKATQVYNREYKVDKTTAGRARNIGETTQEGEIKVQVAADTDTALKALETEDLSVEGQARAKAQKTERQSKLRRQLGFETGSKMYKSVLESGRKSLLIAYRKTQSIKDPAKRARAIKELLRKEYFTKGLTSDLFKSVKNFLGTKEYINNLKQYREAIVEAISTADFVQIERKVPDTDRIFTVYKRTLTNKKDVQDAVDKNLLPNEALNKIDKGQAVREYRKRMPTPDELVEFADQPAINPVTGQRSGLKGTRKDGFAKAIANTMMLDAVMEIRQSESVIEALQDDAIAQLDLMALSDAVGREVDVKFSKSTAVADINNAIDNNINLSVYSQIKFSRSHRDAYEARLTKKRTDLDEKQIKGAVESIFKFVEGENIPNNKRAKYEKMAMHYMVNGNLILPEDGYKVIEAERIAAIKKIDPFSYKNPTTLIEKFAGEVKGARINPDTVQEFTNKTNVGQGVTVYDVADSKEGQRAVRKVIDTHFGKKANPWCLCARTGEYYGSDQAYSVQERDQMVADQEAEGRSVQVTEYKEDGQTVYELTVTVKPDPKNELKESFVHWKNYNKQGNGYKIAFKNGKLLCFRDGNKKQWWNRNDEASDKIHFTVKEVKGDVESTFSVVPEDGTKTLTQRIKGKMPNAEVFTLDDNIYYNIKSNTTYVDGAIVKQKTETAYKKSRMGTGVYVSGVATDESVPDMQLSRITKDVETLDGDILTKELEGTVALASGPYKVYEDMKVKINHVTNVRAGGTQSITVNGIRHSVDAKFSKSAAEINYSKALNSIKFSRKKQDPYIAYQLNIARELGNTSDEIIYARLEQELKNGTLLREAQVAAFKEAYGDQAQEIIQQDGNSIKDLQKNINKFYLPKVRAFAKDIALKKYAKLIKATKDIEEQQDLINSFLINYGRPIRSGKVLNITTNRALLAEMEKAFGKEVMKPYSLEKVQGGEKVMVNNKDIDLYQSITPIKLDPAKYKETINSQAIRAKDFLFDDILGDDSLSNGQKKSLVQLIFYGQKGPGRKLYKLGVFVEGMRAAETTLEHEITANDMHNAIIDVIDGKKSETELRSIIDKAYVHVLPKKINDIFKKLNKTSKRNLQGYESMPEVLQYLGKLDLKGNIGLFNFSKSKPAVTIHNAIMKSKSVKDVKGITILDFDDTLATSKSLIRFTRPDGSQGTLTPEQYASTYEDLLDLGYKFDFSEFNKVIDGKPAPLLNKAKKLAGKFGTKDMFVLTARPSASAKAIKEFLKQNGLDIPLKNITGLGNSTAEAKALWVADKVADGYNDFYFADDALKNVQAVQNMLDQFDVKSKVQQARIKFSKSKKQVF